MFSQKILTRSEESDESIKMFSLYPENNSDIVWFRLSSFVNVDLPVASQLSLIYSQLCYYILLSTLNPFQICYSNPHHWRWGAFYRVQCTQASENKTFTQIVDDPWELWPYIYRYEPKHMQPYGRKLIWWEFVDEQWRFQKLSTTHAISWKGRRQITILSYC